MILDPLIIRNELDRLGVEEPIVSIGGSEANGQELLIGGKWGGQMKFKTFTPHDLRTISKTSIPVEHLMTLIQSWMWAQG